jgi:Mg2+/Co2+ transporter CorB
LDEHQIITICILIFVLLCFSAFFSCCETGMISVNRYRLKHLTKKSKAARRVQALLDRPDRLLGVILLCNTFVNSAAASLLTLLTVSLMGEQTGAITASLGITALLLIFGEVSPKTLAVLYPEKVAFPASFILEFLLKILYPLVWLVNTIANNFLRLFGVNVENAENQQEITSEELRTVVHEAAGRIPSKHRLMLLSILDLEKITIEDIMTPRSEVVGLDLDDDWNSVKMQLANTQHSFLPVYRQDINNLIGVIHAKKALQLVADHSLDVEKLERSLSPAFYIPLGTTLTKQLINFQKNKERFALVVDEYGDIQGLITLEDILEEIVGEFTTNVGEVYTSIVSQSDGSYFVEGGITIREFNRHLPWKLSSDGPKTLSGLVIDYLQIIPEVGTCCLIDNIPMEVIHVHDNRIKTLKIMPPLKRKRKEKK